MKPIILVGYMGAGKSTVGKLLARQQKLSFYDTDAMIEKEQNRTISDIFAKEGEQAFRDMETALIRRLIAEGMTDAVLSVGGGLPVREENRMLLKELGTVVYLMADRDTVVKRVQGSNNRPLLQGENLAEKVERMLTERDPLYRAAADLLIDTNRKPIERLAKEITQAVKK